MDALIKSGKKIISYLGLILFLAFNLNAHAQIFLDSDFTGADPSFYSPWANVNYIDPNFVYSGWYVNPNGLWNGTVSTKGIEGVYVFPNGGVNDAFAFYVCGPADASDSTLAFALADNHYIHFRLSPRVGSIDLNSKKVIFKIKRIGYNSPRIYSVFTNIGGFQEGNQIFTTSSMEKGNYTETQFSFIMPATGYGNITDSIEFRIYAYAAAYCYHGTSLTDFVIQDPATLYSLSLTGTSGGTVTSIPQGERFEEGTVVQLKATPDAGYHFAGWSGDVSGKGNPRTITMTSSKAVTANFAANVDGKMQVGMNLAGIADWQTNHPFVDLFKMSRTWLTRSTSGVGWDSGKSNEIPLDQYGWPTHIPFTAADGSTHYVHTIFDQALSGGNYKVVVTGTGKIAFYGAASTGVIALTGGTREFSLPIAAGNTSNLQVVIPESQSADPVRNIKIIRPNYVLTYETQTFQTSYLGVLGPFGVLRFMDWGATNGSPLATWADRTLEETYTQARLEGAALEYMVELANTLQKDLWINIPHIADDNYVRQAARLLRDTVGPNQKIHVEYSNETWNTAWPYPQTTYVQDQGQALNLDSDRWVAGQKYAVLRSVQIWKIFQEEFGADARVVRVLGTQVGWKAITDMRVAAVNDPAINPDYLMPDVLATAPYFGRGYTPNDIPPVAASYPTVDEILNVTAPVSIAEQQSSVRANKAIADAQGMELVCYEAGQGFVGVGGAENDTVLTDILIAANRDNRMYQRYADYLAMLDAEGVSMCAFFSDISRPSKWGSWGVLEYLEQPVSQAPKYRALVDFITEPADLSVSSAVNPNPVYLNDALTYTFNVINYGPSAASNVTLIDTLPAGVAFVSTTPQGSCANNNGVVTCNLGSLASGASTTVTITATATATGTLSNTAAVSGGGTDPNPANNSTTATVTVNPVADLSVTLTDTPDPVLLGQTVTYTTTVTNNGPSTATNVTATGTLPTCNLGTLASGASASCTATVTPSSVGTLNQNMSVSGGEFDPNGSNNTATATTTVNAPDLLPTALSASKSGAKVIVSDTVKNQGNGNAGSFTVAYYLSTNTTYEPGTDLPLAGSSGGSGTCTRPVTSLAPGLSSSIANKTCYKPTSAVTGTRYYVLVVDDSTSAVVESSETNNVRATSGQMWW